MPFNTYEKLSAAIDTHAGSVRNYNAHFPPSIEGGKARHHFNVFLKEPKPGTIGPEHEGYAAVIEHVANHHKDRTNDRVVLVTHHYNISDMPHTAKEWARKFLSGIHQRATTNKLSHASLNEPRSDYISKPTQNYGV